MGQSEDSRQHGIPTTYNPLFPNFLDRTTFFPYNGRVYNSTMQKILQIVLYADMILLMLSILLQARSVGLSSTFGGEGGVFRKKRGAEKVLFIITIVTMIVFLILSFFLPFVSSIILKLQS